MDELLIIDPFRYQMLQKLPKPNPKRFKHNWRIDMLAVAKNQPEKMAPFRSPDDVDPSREKRREQQEAAAHKAEDARMHVIINRLMKERTKELTLFPPRIYAEQRKVLKDIEVGGKKVEGRLKKLLDMSKKTTYQEYKEAKRQKKSNGKKKADGKGKDSSAKGQKSSKKSAGKQKSASKSGSKKDKKETIAAAIEYCKKLAEPKKIHLPPPINRGKGGNIDDAHCAKMACPKRLTPKYVDETDWKNQHFVPLATLCYQTSDRTYELAHPKVTVVIEQRQLGVVEPNALTYRASARIKEIAIPKPKSASADTDFKEDAFKVSPTALKYKATERIIELAKPTDRK